MENIIILDKMYINKNRIEYYFSTKGCYDKYFNKDKSLAQKVKGLSPSKYS